MIRNEDRQHCLCNALDFERHAGLIATAVPTAETAYFQGFLRQPLLKTTGMRPSLAQFSVHLAPKRSNDDAFGGLLLSQSRPRQLRLQLGRFDVDLRHRAAVETTSCSALQRVAAHGTVRQLRLNRHSFRNQQRLQVGIGEIQTRFKQRPHCLRRVQKVLMAFFERTGFPPWIRCGWILVIHWRLSLLFDGA